MTQELKKQIISLSRRLMAIESTEPNIKEQKACFNTLENLFKEDFYIKRYVFRGHPALVLSTTVKKTVDIIFSGHIDVVPGEKSLFRPKMRGTKLYGRGAYDMKAAIVACMYAVVEYRKKGGNKEIAIMLTSDEETSGHGTQMLLEKEGYRGHFAFIADGGHETGIVLRQKGFAQIRVTLPGKSAHASEPWKGDNPLLKIARLEEAIVEVFPIPSAKTTWRTSVVLTRIGSENSLNQIPEQAVVYFDIRYIDGGDLKTIISLVKKMIGTKGKVEVVATNNIFCSQKDNHYVQTLARILSEQTRKKISFVHENGTSDAVFFTEHGIPASLYRPKGGGAHQNEEWVDTNSLYEMYEILIEFLKRS